MKNHLQTMKEQAKRLRISLNDAGKPVSHSQSLELVAHQLGHRDWNTAHAAAGNPRPGPPANLWDKVAGHYLGQPFTATVTGVEAQAGGTRWRTSFQLDEPVDVVTFDSFSNFRSRITVTLNSDGRTTEKTSNGVPHMVLEG